MNPLISVIYPVLNESQTDYLEKNLDTFKKLKSDPKFEFFFIDGGSHDETVSVIENAGFFIETLEHSTRMGRLIRGYELANGQIILFHHPRSFLDKDAWIDLKTIGLRKEWGGFTHRFDLSHPLLDFTSWYSNRVRFDLRNIVYLDHCIYFHRDLISPREIENVPIFEDTLLSEKLLKKMQPTRLKGLACTSAIRFEKNGLLRQALKNQKAKLEFYFNRNYQNMNRDYEEGLNLNQKKDEK